jgi:ABC-type lipopolysaccharide export system ATPase subunit
VIKDGAILRSGAPEDVAADPRVREIYLGENFRLG